MDANGGSLRALTQRSAPASRAQFLQQ